ncbi:MAG: hypothetical protein KGN33_09485 [Paracoccaceae bacterium]|nr:hypothetical protein [Paracoccaceae bacterium]
MAERFSFEIGLLRDLAKNVKTKPMPQGTNPLTWRDGEGPNYFRLGEASVTSIQPEAHKSFATLTDQIVGHSPSMARGALYANVQSELFAFVRHYEGREPSEISGEDIDLLMQHFEGWLRDRVRPQRIFVPCLLTRFRAPRFAIGPITFEFIDNVATSDFYPKNLSPDDLGRDGFDRLLAFMRDTNANWVARFEVEGCEQERAHQVGELATDLAIVALQLVAPKLDTRAMGRVDHRRGHTFKRRLSEADGIYAAGWWNTEPGLPIGAGILEELLKSTQPVFSAVGGIVRSFASGRYRLPSLEQAWCDSAYWLHEALAEPIDSIAVAKLETSLEVLLRAESSRGSQARLMSVLDALFGLGPDAPISPGSTVTTAQYTKKVVGDRSQILHGTWSTLNARMAAERSGMEGFVVVVLREFALKIDLYAKEQLPEDEIQAFLSWVKQQSSTAAPNGGGK